MPLRGESVGSAYVRIYADGSAVPDGIRDALNDAEPSVRDAGDKHGRAYEEEFDKSVKQGYKKHFNTTQGDMFEGLNDALTDRLAKLELADRTFKSKKWKEFIERTRQEFGDAGALAAKSIEQRFRDSGNLDGLADEMEAIGFKVREAQAEILREQAAEEQQHREDQDKAWELSLDHRARMWGEMLDEAHRDNKAFDARWRKMLEDQDKAYEIHIGNLSALDKAYSDRYAEQQSEAIRLNRELDRRNRTGLQQFKRNLSELSTEIEKLNEGTSRFTHRRLEEWANQLRKIVPDLADSDHNLNLFNDRLDVLHRRLDDSNPRLDAFDRHVVRVGDTMGRVFGRGSRNDFLNFFGSLVRGLTQLPRLLTGVARPFVSIGRSMSDAFESGGGGLSGTLKALQSGLGGIAGVAGKAAAGIGGFAVFIGFLGLALGPVVSLLSGLLGVLTALGSSVVMGAIGALAGFGPALVASGGVVAGVIALVQAFKDADDSGSALDRQMQRIKDTGKGLWDQFREAATSGLEGTIRQVNNALERTEPLVAAAGTGFHAFLQAFSRGLDSPAFQDFIKEFSVFLPRAMRDLGSIAENTLGGIGGILRGSIPSAESLLGWLDRISGKFSEWANSAKGQQQIKDFLDRASDSAESLGGFLESVWDFLWKIIGAGKDSGDTIFDQMAASIESATKFFEENPEALEDWFQHAEDTATQIGDVITAVIALADTLDSESARVEQMYLFKGIAGAVTLLANQIRVVDAAARGIGEVLAIWGEGFGHLGRAIWYVLGGEWAGFLVDGLRDGLTAAAEAVSGFLSDLWSSITSAFTGGGGGGGLQALTIRPHFDASGVVEGVSKLPGIVSRAVGRAVDAFSGFAGRAAGAVGDVAGRVASRFTSLPGRVQGIVDQVVSRFGNVAERIGRNIGDLWSQIASRFNGIPAAVAGVVDNIVGAFVGLAGRILGAIGPINIGSLIHVPDPGGGVPYVPGVASGGYFGRITNGPMLRWVGEDGPEAIVPLNRDLARVDPSVRALSAIAQGAPMASGGVVGAGKTINANGWQIVTPSLDPRIVAVEVLDELAAAI